MQYPWLKLNPLAAFDCYNRKGHKCPSRKHTAPGDHWERVYMGGGGGGFKLLGG